MPLLQESDRLELHSDLYDTHIDVCTPELLLLLQDNFDWQDLRRDMLPGILGQFEYLGKTMYTHVLSAEYAARVHDPHTYDVVSRDIIGRWAYPMVPDANLLPDCTYRCSGHMVYKETDVTLARSCTLARDCVVGGASSIGERTTVESSVIGRGCKIGAGVTIVGSYLWDNVTVEDGASLNGCICCNGVVVGKDAMVAPGCVLGAGVRVGAGCGLPRYARFLAAEGRPEEEDDDDDAGDDDDEEEDAEEGLDASGASGGAGAYSERQARRATAAATAAAGSGGSLLGSGGHGRLWRVVPTAMSIGFERLWAADAVAVGEESEEEEEEMEEEEGMDEGEAFASEVGDTVRRAIGANHTVDNLALEINSLKFAQNRTFSDCVHGIIPSLLAEAGLASKTKKEKVGWLKSRVKQWAPLLKRFVQSALEQKALMEVLVSTFGENELVDVFVHALNELYDKDLLSQDVILEWAEEVEEEDDDAESDDRRCLANASDMITWLKEDDDDDDDDDDD
jgi:translation initiation factor eIF-2B subunit epsilon